MRLTPAPLEVKNFKNSAGSESASDGNADFAAVTINCRGCKHHKLFEKDRNMYNTVHSRKWENYEALPF